MKYDKYWISPEGNIIPLEGSIDRHIHMVIQNPEKFGISKKQIDALHKKYKEKLYSEGNAREEIITELLKKGWIRIRYVSQYDTFVIQLNVLGEKSKNSIWDWAVGVTSSGKKGFDNVSKFTGFKILDINANVIVEGILQDIIKYSGVFSESVKRTFVNRLMKIEDYKPKSKKIVEEFLDNL